MILNRFSVILLLCFGVGILNAKEFNVYWNIPTFSCRTQYKMPIVNVTELYGIYQNDGDTFRGNEISILYDPGMFPALLQNSSSKQLVRRNGGVPQVGDLNEHLKIFAKQLDELIPDRKNDGLAIIDFESWRPVFRQNFGTLQPYKDLSIKLVRNSHRFWPQSHVEQEADYQFTQHAREFMEKTIELARQLRPMARWGYYGLPFCFNGKGNNIENCGENIKLENDGTKWLYDGSDIIYPSIYMSEQILPQNRPKMVRGRIRESIRLTKNRPIGVDKAKVIAYHRYVFTDTGNYLSERDTLAAMNALRSTGADGVILWGSSNDLNSKQKCEEFYQYLETVLGPIMRSFHRSYLIDVNQEIDE